MWGRFYCYYQIHFMEGKRTCLLPLTNLILKGSYEDALIHQLHPDASVLDCNANSSCAFVHFATLMDSLMEILIKSTFNYNAVIVVVIPLLRC